MLERQQVGILKAKAAGKYKGRKPTARLKASDARKLYSEGRPHRMPARKDQAHQQRHRSPEPSCPRLSSLPGIRETASSARDPCLQRSASSDPPANRARILSRESNPAVRFHTARVISDRAIQPQRRLLSVVS